MNSFRKSYKNDFSSENPSQELLDSTLEKMNGSKNQNISKKNKKPLRWGVLVPVAIFLLFSMSVAATQIAELAGIKLPRISEWSIVGGHLHRRGETPDEVSKATYEKIMSEIGVNLNKSTVYGNIRVTVQDFIADSETMYINYDIETVDGSPLIPKTEYSEAFNRRQRFESEYAQIGDFKLKIYSFRIDNGKDPSRASYEGEVPIADRTYDENHLYAGKKYFDSLEGKEVKLVFEDYKTPYPVVDDIGFKFSNIKELYDLATPLTAKDFISLGIEQTYANGRSIEMLAPKKGQDKIFFSDKYPNSYIDTVGFGDFGEYYNELKGRYQTLFISITPGSEEEKQGLLENLNMNFMNINMGAFVPSDFGYKVYRVQNNGYNVKLLEGRIILTLGRYDRKTDDGMALAAEDLADYTLLGTVIDESTVQKGPWTFDFKINKVGETRVFNLSQEIKFLDRTATIEKITISPLNIWFYGKGIDLDYVNKNTKNDGVNDLWEENYFVMKDGSKIKITEKGDSRIPFVEESFSANVILDNAIIPGEVEALILLGQRVELK